MANRAQNKRSMSHTAHETSSYLLNFDPSASYFIEFKLETPCMLS